MKQIYVVSMRGKDGTPLSTEVKVGDGESASALAQSVATENGATLDSVFPKDPFFTLRAALKECLGFVEAWQCHINDRGHEPAARTVGNTLNAARDAYQFTANREVLEGSRMEATSATPAGRSMSQVDALVAQAAAIARFQDTGEAADAKEASRLAKISRVDIGPKGELLPMLDATYVSQLGTENTGGGCMVDFITLKDGRVLTLNDEAIGVFMSKDAFYDDNGDNALHFMYMEASYKYELRNSNVVRTNDGCTFKKQPDGSWIAGDKSVADFDALYEAYEGQLIKGDSMSASD
jgi:hypothetical protein